VFVVLASLEQKQYFVFSSSLPVEALAEGVPVMLTLLDHFYKIKIFYLFYKLGSIPLCSDYIFLEVNAIKTLALHI